MNHKEFISAISLKLNLPPASVEKYVETVVDVLKTSLLEGNAVAVHGFGSFELKRKEERLSVHPATGVRTIVPPKQVVNFKQSSTFRARLKDLQKNG